MSENTRTCIICNKEIEVARHIALVCCRCFQYLYATQVCKYLSYELNDTCRVQYFRCNDILSEFSNATFNLDGLIRICLNTCERRVKVERLRDYRMSGSIEQEKAFCNNLFGFLNKIKAAKF